MVDVIVMATVTPNTVHNNAKSTYTASTRTFAAYSISLFGSEWAIRALARLYNNNTTQ